MQTLLLVRHAFAGSNRDRTASSAVPGDGLTAEGRLQARALGESLRDQELALGVSTELARTRETLTLALDGRGRDLPRLVVPELNEIGFGSFDGGPLAAYRSWARSQPPDLTAPGGGESRAQAAGRFAAGLRILLGR